MTDFGFQPGILDYRMLLTDWHNGSFAIIVAELRRDGITSWYGIAMALHKRGVPTATGRGIWEPAQFRRVMERLK
jgi:hypothetical protein